MKTITKWIIGASTLACGVLAYKHYDHVKIQRLCKQTLANACQCVEEYENIVGTWIDMHAQMHSEYGLVFVGGVTTSSHTYDFIADARHAQIIVFDKQVRV
ncbi:MULTISPECIES: hypothetical protein [unclassified Granulicatella]|uniref:hypothetical protein n=1 Tax=unclassified Granulicatella TaxID=2630493 RepID=UPI0010732BF7|nr:MULTISPECIES: hypothetical protein [unclassified Granulicatella]MBF0779712.1 hypothetical protein [Granulicatella sp. 19428wC4_WM01]TFU96233.1 hypothetical protein E4T68_01270 [Granulicatella sp. WM01]